MTTKAAVANGINGVNWDVHVPNGVGDSNGVFCNGATNGICYNGATNGFTSNGVASNKSVCNGFSNGIVLHGASNGISRNGASSDVPCETSNGVDDEDSAPAPYRLNKVYGVLLPTYITKKLVDELRVMPLRDDDLFIVTYPKSGTTWMQQIVKLIRSNGVDDSRPVTEVIPWIEQYPEKVQALSAPRGIMCHMSYSMMPGGDPAKSPAKYIYIARNPKDVAVSYYHHTKAFKHFQFTGGWDRFFELFMSGNVSRGSWFDHVLGWWEHKDADNILFLTYEEMKQDLRAVVKKVAEFIGCSLTPAVLESITEQSTFSSMKRNPSANYSWQDKDRRDGTTAFIRKGLVGDWMNHFSEEQSQEFDAEYYKRMAGSGLRFNFSQ